MSKLTWDISSEIQSALDEDHVFDDVTAALLPADCLGQGGIITREPMVLCGRPWVQAVFAQIDPKVKIDWKGNDGDFFEPNALLCRLEGAARSLLSGERLALNFLQTLSATATQTRHFCQALEGTQTRLLDTRKTLPGWRQAQKYAVRCGGGTNHRMHLADAFLIKENHIATMGGIDQAVRAAKEAHPTLLLEVEVESLSELEQALSLGVKRIMLDNFDVAMMAQGVSIAAGKAELEASGNVDIDSIREIAATGVDYISVGAITKHINAIDLSMQINIA